MRLRLRSDDPAAITRYTVLLLVAIILAGGVSYLISKAVTASDQSHQAISLAKQASGFAAALATERNQTILRDCREQNHRHRVTDRKLDGLLAPYARRARTPAQHRQLRASHRSTLLLIGALAPLQDCARLVTTDQATR